jgi:hypothetical protein
MIYQEWAQRTSEISCSTREINLVFPSSHVFFCLLYKQITKFSEKQKNVRPWQCVLQQIIFSHVKISYFLCVFKYDFSHWPKTLYDTYVYIINWITFHITSKAEWFLRPVAYRDYWLSTRLLWRSVTVSSSRIRYENRNAPMQSGIV